MKCSLDISNILEEFSSLSILLFSCLFALFIEKALLISPCYSLELCIQLDISFPLSFAFFLFFPQLFVKVPQTTTLPSCISFSLEWFYERNRFAKILSIVISFFFSGRIRSWVYLSFTINCIRNCSVSSRWFAFHVSGMIWNVLSWYFTRLRSLNTFVHLMRTIFTA